MGHLIKILIAVVGIPLGIYVMRSNYQLTRLFGYNDLAERYLGVGGTYSMWKLIGAIIVIGPLIYLFS